VCVYVCMCMRGSVSVYVCVCARVCIFVCICMCAFCYCVRAMIAEHTTFPPHPVVMPCLPCLPHVHSSPPVKGCLVLVVLDVYVLHMSITQGGRSRPVHDIDGKLVFRLHVSDRRNSQ
jgi:hypothetical protein